MVKGPLLGGKLYFTGQLGYISTGAGGGGGVGGGGGGGVGMSPLPSL